MSALEERRRRTALHEAAHGLYAHECGFVVHAIRCVPQGETVIALPVQVETLASFYRLDPYRTLHQLRLVVGVIEAPAVALAAPATGSDEDAALAWRAAWESARQAVAPAGPAWLFVRAGARRDVQQWLSAPGKREQLDWLAEVLLERRVIRRQAWRHLMEQSGRRQTPSVRQVPDQTRILKQLKPENVCANSWRDYGNAVYPALVCW